MFCHVEVLAGVCRENVVGAQRGIDCTRLRCGCGCECYLAISFQINCGRHKIFMTMMCSVLLPKIGIASI